MRTLRKTLAVLAICLVGGVGLAACENDDKANAPDLSPVGDAGPGGSTDMSGDAGGTLEFEAFVVGLIKNDTSDSSLPTTTEDKTFTDAMDPTIFAPLFM